MQASDLWQVTCYLQFTLTHHTYLSQDAKAGPQDITTYLSKLNNEHFNNGAVLTLTKIIKHVMSSASEAETTALFYNCKAAASLHISLEEMGHPQMKT